MQREKRGPHTVMQGIQTKYNSHVVQMLLCYKLSLGSLLPSLAPKVSKFFLRPSGCFDGGAVAVLPAPALAVPPTLLPGLANTQMLSAPGRCFVLNIESIFANFTMSSHFKFPCRALSQCWCRAGNKIANGRAWSCSSPIRFASGLGDDDRPGQRKALLLQPGYSGI